MNPVAPSRWFWFVLLVVFWAFHGLVGRDAWRAEEALALAPILDWLSGERSVWASPAPLHTLIAGLFADSGLAGDMQDGARIASGVFTLTALLFVGLAARALFGAGFGLVAALALLGGFGLMLRAHALLPETALLAAWAALLWGVAEARQRPKRATITIALAITALTLGLRGLPDFLAATLVVLTPLASTTWRAPGYRLAALSGIGWAIALIAIALAWLFMNGQLSAWWSLHGIAHYLPLRSPGSAYSELVWFAWPLWPLALAAVWHAHRRLTRETALHPPLLALAILLLAALAPAWSRDGALLPALAPLALLAAYAVDVLRRGASQAFYWFGVLCFLFFALAFWVYFVALEWGTPVRLATHMARLTPNYQTGSVGVPDILLAAGVTLLWLIAIPLFPRAKIRPILVWATGMVLVWTLLASLFRPWIEAGWGYRPMIADLARHLPAHACLDVDVDPAMATMLRVHLDVERRANCPWRLIRHDRKSGAEEEATTGWHDGSVLLWQGWRPRQKSLGYRLEYRVPEPARMP